VLHSTQGTYFVCNNACVLFIEYVLIGNNCLKPF